MWVLNILLFLLFALNSLLYQPFVDAGAPCYSYVAQLGDDDSPQPVCWYDPTNTNEGRKK